MTIKNDSNQRISEYHQLKLSEYNKKYGIPYKTLIGKALKYAFEHAEQVWGVK